MKNLVFPLQTTVRDTTVREGVQREERQIPTSAKLWVVEKLLLAGFKRLEVTNFADPKRLPQFADAEDLLKQIYNHRSLSYLRESVELTAITINKRAVDRAVAARRDGYGPNRILLLVSVSEAYQKTNSGMSIDAYWKMAEMGIDTGVDVEAVLKIGAMVERIVGRRLRSECVHTGRIPKALKMPA